MGMTMSANTSSAIGLTLWFLSFFCSSRGRHTRWNCYWSSDVCSSDLIDFISTMRIGLKVENVCIVDVRSILTIHSQTKNKKIRWTIHLNNISNWLKTLTILWRSGRSEERRVGKECRSESQQYREQNSM